VQEGIERRHGKPEMGGWMEKMKKAREEAGEMSKGTGRNRKEAWETWEGRMDGNDGKSKGRDRKNE
jgi:hypothetical protein